MGWIDPRVGQKRLEPVRRSRGETTLKALDTSALIAVLRGDRNAAALARRLRGLEVATTEVNMLELQVLVGREPAGVRAARREALNRLRRCLTVLPIDARASESAARKAGRLKLKASPFVLGMLGALEANGCDELITATAAGFPGRWNFRTTRIIL